ncbi:hypothetical protein FACS1894124_8280 [Spirochaetia bacterium]|nr:hypothetical protein FACS1894124_8280 [Spirochaetia bacterium]
MKKFAFFVVMTGLMAATLAFADENYTVRSVSGRVERELAPHKWEDVTIGTVITASTVINTGINARLVLQAGDELITIQSGQRGTVDQLARLVSASGVRIGGEADTVKDAPRAVADE